MINFYKKTLLITVLTCFSSGGFSQTTEIKVKFIGNCGLYMTDDESNLYFDFPYKSGAYKYMEYDKAEIVSIPDNAIFIFTHRHADHYSKKSLRKLDGQKFDPWKISELEQIGQSIPQLEMQVFKTQHKVFGISFKHYSFLLTWHGKKIYISGDTGDLEHIKNLKGIDWAFMNPWLYMNALRANITIDTKKFGLYHLYPDQKIDGEVPTNVLILKNQGERIIIP